MNRAQFNKLLSVFSGPVNTLFTSFSGAASLINPAATSFLKLYAIKVDGPSSLGTTTKATVDFADGAASAFTRFVVGNGDSHTLSFGSRFAPVTDNLVVTSDNDAAVTIVYHETPFNA
jgi:hypothetical protein